MCVLCTRAAHLQLSFEVYKPSLAFTGMNGQEQQEEEKTRSTKCGAVRFGAGNKLEIRARNFARINLIAAGQWQRKTTKIGKKNRVNWR